MGAAQLDDRGDAGPAVQVAVAAGAEQRHQVAAGGSAERADALRVEVEALHLLGLAQPLDGGRDVVDGGRDTGSAGRGGSRREGGVAGARPATGRRRARRCRPCRRAPSCRRARTRSTRGRHRTRGSKSGGRAGVEQEGLAVDGPVLEVGDHRDRPDPWRVPGCVETITPSTSVDSAPVGAHPARAASTTAHTAVTMARVGCARMIGQP